MEALEGHDQVGLLPFCQQWMQATPCAVLCARTLHGCCGLLCGCWARI